jgi:hypothetical protein
MAIQQYNPASTDRSGEIYAQGMKNVADLNLQTMSNFGEDIGNALVNIGSVYGEIEGRKAKGRSFKKTLEVMGPALGMTTDKLKATFGDIKSDLDYANLSDTLLPILPSYINATLGYGRLGVQQNAPVTRNIINNANTRAEEGPAGDYSYIE